MTFAPAFTITNRMTQAITRIERVYVDPRLFCDDA